MHVNLDPQLVDKIANEVKSQGVFDQFRKDSMADVDTKPAYQNLRQRVENTVNKFLSEQEWTPDLNKNQLREKLRKHITEAGFLDVGVERIVDQVVNPKIATVFQPKIEDIAYKYLGIPKPQAKTEITNGPALNGILQIETDLMPTDLEQVSPDSDKATVKSDSKDDMETDDKLDDFESPPFEPIEAITNDLSKSENMDDNDEKPEVKQIPQTSMPECETEIKERSLTEDFDIKVKVEPTTSPKLEEDTEANISAEVSQESQLSQVSSDSHLSIVTNNNTQDEQSTACDIKEESNVNISEEAQMPKFNENSNSGSEKKTLEPLHFDIKKDEIKFEGTERKLEPPTEALSPNTSDEQRLDSSLENKTVDSSQYSDIPLPTLEYSFDKETDFKFCKIEVKVDVEEPTKLSLEDSADKELHIIEKSEMSQCSLSQHSITPPAVKQDKIPKSPSATSSPIQPQKSNSREHSSSRHKKHSKDKRSDRDRDRDRHSSSGHKTSSSSSSKHYSSKVSSSSHRTGGSSSDHHHHRDRSSSQKVKHSSRSEKSSKSHHDSKDHSRDRSRSRSDKSKDKPSKERPDRSRLTDDHYSSKQKWRKSTDSNDGDSSQEGTRNLKNGNNSRDNTTNGTLNNSNASSGASTTTSMTPANNVAVQPAPTASARQKIVILDNLLENPSTDFIEIASAQVQIISSEHCSPYDEDNLFYFNEEPNMKYNTSYRIRLLTNIMENFRKILQTNLDFPRKQSTTDSELSVSTEMNRPDSISPTDHSRKRRLASFSLSSSLTSATLTIDCIEYETASNAHCVSKRFKFDGSSATKGSPTHSELSVNSKENEFVDKNQDLNDGLFESQVVNKSAANNVLSGRRKHILNRNQRYSSEDLYKPRPILSQRSRRRGLDATVI